MRPLAFSVRTDNTSSSIKTAIISRSHMQYAETTLRNLVQINSAF